MNIEIYFKEYPEKFIIVLFLLLGSKIVEHIPRKLEIFLANPIIKVISLFLLFYFYLFKSLSLSLKFLVSLLLALIIYIVFDYLVYNDIVETFTISIKRYFNKKIYK